MSGPALLRAFVVLLATLVAAVVWSPRPQILSLFLLALCSLILDDYRRKGINRLWLLVPIFVLWSNLHGGYPLGLMLIGASLAGDGIDTLFAGVANWRSAWPRMRTLLIVLAACALVVVINPNGLNMWKIPFQTVGVGVLQDAIPEWASPDFHDLIQQPFLWMLVITVVCFALVGRRAHGADWITVVLFGVSGLMARRNFGPFAMVAAPILARYLVETWQAVAATNPWPGRRRDAAGWNKPVSAGLRKATNLFLIATLGLAACIKLYVVSQPQFVRAYERTLFPVDAVNWLKENPQPGNLFNSYAWGGYLTWAYPEKAVFVDGRTDLYGDELIGDWLKVTQGSEGWQDVLRDWQVGFVLLEADQPVNKLLAEDGWRQVYRDDIAVVYQRSLAQ